MAPDGATEMTIDELARRAGTTTRNVRAYRERGLLPPPRLVGRTTYYGQAHVARLRHIAQLLERGFSLASIKELFNAWESGYGLGEVLGFEEALDATWNEAPPAMLTRQQATAIFGGEAGAIDSAIKAGILSKAGAKGYQLHAPQLLDVGAELVAAGVPMRALLREAEQLNDDLDRIAQRWTAMFSEHVWAAYVKRGMPPGELQRLTDLLQRLRPLVGATVAPLLGEAIRRHSTDLTAAALSGPASAFEPAAKPKNERKTTAQSRKIAANPSKRRIPRSS